MAGVLTVYGEQIVLEALANKTAPQNLALLLYTNNVTPGRTTAAGDLTEAAGSGYARAALPAAAWTFTAGASPPGRLAHPAVTFTFTAALGAPVYGYGLIQTTSGLLVAAERFPDGPYPITVAGEAITITPTLTAQATDATPGPALFMGPMVLGREAGDLGPAEPLVAGPYLEISGGTVDVAGAGLTPFLVQSLGAARAAQQGRGRAAGDYLPRAQAIGDLPTGYLRGQTGVGLVSSVAAIPPTDLVRPGTLDTFLRGDGTFAPLGLGDWQATPFNAADYRATTGTVTVPPTAVLTNRSTLIGHTLVWALHLSGITVSAVTTSLLLRLPRGARTAAAMIAVVAYSNDGAPIPSTLTTTVGGTDVVLGKSGGGTFKAGTHTHAFTVTLEIQ